MKNNHWPLDFMELTTAKWKNKIVNNKVFGFQIQANTSWLPGLKDTQINELQNIIGTKLPDDVEVFLNQTCGLDKEQINMNPNSSSREDKYKNLWSLNHEHLSQYKNPILSNNDNDFKKNVISILNEFNFDLDLLNYFLVPVYSHRYILTHKENKIISPVLSVYNNDIVIYGNDFKEYLNHEFLNQ